MKAINQTRNTTIASKVIEPKSLLDQSLGLLKYQTPAAMLLHTRYGIHTFSMHYVIDVLILDEKNHVAVLKENLQPNRIFLWNPKYKTVLELPPGTIEKTKTKLGDKITM